MTAIVVGLGGKASSTQRANALPNLVRTGSKYVHSMYISISIYRRACMVELVIQF